MESVWEGETPHENFLRRLFTAAIERDMGNAEYMRSLRYNHKQLQHDLKIYGPWLERLGIDYFGAVMKACDEKPAAPEPPKPKRKEKLTKCNIKHHTLPPDLMDLLMSFVPPLPKICEPPEPEVIVPEWDEHGHYGSYGTNEKILVI